jgi:hypothetical protein
MSLLMSLLPASGEFVSEFPSPRVILSFFPHPWPYRLGWPCQELKLPPASLSVLWGVLGPLTTSRWQPFERVNLRTELEIKFSGNEVWQYGMNFRHLGEYVGFKVLTAVVMKSTIFWDITPCSPLKIDWRFGGIYRLHLQGRRIIRARNQRESRW